MANVAPFIPKIFPWETGKTIDKADLVKMVKLSADPGGWTKFGITEATWKTVGYDKDGDGDIDADDLSIIDVHDYEHVVKTAFWDRWKADSINSQSIAEILVDWLWASGYYGISEPQKLLGVKADGKVGPMTIHAINSYHNQEELHQRIYDQRMVYIDRIVKANPQWEQFKQGWKNRIISLYKYFKP